MGGLPYFPELIRYKTFKESALSSTLNSMVARKRFYYFREILIPKCSGAIKIHVTKWIIHTVSIIPPTLQMSLYLQKHYLGQISIIGF